MAIPAGFGLRAQSLTGDGVRLRRYRQSDIEDVRIGCDDPLNSRYLPMLPSPYTEADARWWCNEGNEVAFEAGGGNYAIADPATDRLVGGIGITALRDACGEIGYWVSPGFRGRGYATAATVTLTAYAFSAGYARLRLRTEVENSPSQRVALAAGYRREGVARSAASGRDGNRRDMIIWARVIADPPGPTPRALPDLPGDHLADGVVSLRPLSPADANWLHHLCTLSNVEAVCARAASQWLTGTTARLTIRKVPDDAAVGAIALSLPTPERPGPNLGFADPNLGFADPNLGFAVEPAWRGRGYATRAVRLLSTWALREAALPRISAGAAVGDVASQRVLAAAGFVAEGRRRGYLPAAEGHRRDVISYSLLPHDL